MKKMKTMERKSISKEKYHFLIFENVSIPESKLVVPVQIEGEKSLGLQNYTFLIQENNMTKSLSGSDNSLLSHGNIGGNGPFMNENRLLSTSKNETSPGDASRIEKYLDKNFEEELEEVEESRNYFITESHSNERPSQKHSNGRTAPDFISLYSTNKDENSILPSEVKYQNIDKKQSNEGQESNKSFITESQSKERPLEKHSIDDNVSDSSGEVEEFNKYLINESHSDEIHSEKHSNYESASDVMSLSLISKNEKRVLPSELEYQNMDDIQSQEVEESNKSFITDSHSNAQPLNKHSNDGQASDFISLSSTNQNEKRLLPSELKDQNIDDKRNFKEKGLVSNKISKEMRSNFESEGHSSNDNTSQHRLLSMTDDDTLPILPTDLVSSIRTNKSNLKVKSSVSDKFFVQNVEDLANDAHSSKANISEFPLISATYEEVVPYNLASSITANKSNLKVKSSVSDKFFVQNVEDLENDAHSSKANISEFPLISATYEEVVPYNLASSITANKSNLKVKSSVSDNFFVQNVEDLEDDAHSSKANISEFPLISATYEEVVPYNLESSTTANKPYSLHNDSTKARRLSSEMVIGKSTNFFTNEHNLNEKKNNRIKNNIPEITESAEETFIMFPEFVIDNNHVCIVPFERKKSDFEKVIQETNQYLVTQPSTKSVLHSVNFHAKDVPFSNDEDYFSCEECDSDFKTCTECDSDDFVTAKWCDRM